MSQHLETKLLKLATVLGNERIRELGFERRQAFVEHLFNLLLD